jgi:hypothetical protein
MKCAQSYATPLRNSWIPPHATAQQRRLRGKPNSADHM